VYKIERKKGIHDRRDEKSASGSNMWIQECLELRRRAECCPLYADVKDQMIRIDGMLLR